MFHSDMPTMNYIQALWRRVRVAPIRFFGPSLLLIAGLAAGCAHSSKNGIRAGGFEPIPAPLPPLFLNGPMALLLTNAGGFCAHAVLESGTAPQAAKMAAGELMVQGGKMLFAPEPGPKSKKRPRVEDSAFIWDVNENRGFVLNDPLQGYAPISSSRQFTNVMAGAAPNNSAPERIAGHSCQPTEMTVTAGDGTRTVFQVWRATDLKGLPLRIYCPSNGAPTTLTLSKVRLEAVPNDLFLPPSGFAKYDSSEAMMTELALRKANLSRKPTYRIEDSDTVGGRESRLPDRPN
jgi:hypothetical protein